MPYNTRSKSNGDLGDQINSQQGQFVGQGQLAPGQSFDQALSGGQQPQQQAGYDQSQQGYGQQGQGQQYTGYDSNTAYANNNNNNMSSQQNYGSDQQQQSNQGDESLADKVENMLEKLANKISGHKESHSGNDTTAGTGGFSNH